MEILENYPALVGKTIAFSWMAQFSNTIVFATTENEVLIAKFSIDYDNDESEQIEILGKARAIHYLNSDKGKWPREQLGKLGIFDIEDFKKREAEKFEKEKAARAIKLEEKERHEYERLKAKFENKEN